MLDSIAEEDSIEASDEGKSSTGLTLSEISTLFPDGLRSQLLSALDLDGTGVLTSIKIDRATRSIPRDASLLETMFILYEQRGRIVLPAVCRRSVELSYLSSLRDKLGGALERTPSEDSDSLHHEPNDVRFMPHAFDDCVADDPLRLKVREYDPKLAFVV